ncbi:alpha/beta hydrolase family protein [Aliikangiella sp. IMCC44359]|uniref:alpha/beta hydrolase family protein n=1 Tax=Aliikangiella sp. IMCC44359 TaxID=3459125 RepID=UPI00403AF6A7
MTGWGRSFSGRMYAYRTDDKYPKLNFLDPKSEKAKFHQQLKQAFKGKYARVIQSSRDYKRRIIAVTGDNEPGLYYLYKDNQLMQIAKVRASIDRKQFSSMSPIEFKARDGLLINGYISYPNNQESTAPMVVMVHGGPFGVRDYWGFDREVQLLTSHGYSVLQVNYRGSGSYGRKFKESGYQQYGLKMQDDLTDATLWAIKNGVADKNKICIYGGSYGGYAALMGVAKEPDLYQCAIGFAGVYDLPLKYETGDIQEANWGDAWLEKSMGTDMKVLAENSPARLTHKIKAKLFIAHGEQDKRVPFEHYEKLTEALDKNKKPYESMIFEGEAHGIANTKNKIKFYKKMLSFLDEVFEE